MNITIIDETVKPMKSDGKYTVEFEYDAPTYTHKWWKSYPPTMSFQTMLEDAYLCNAKPVTSISVWGQEGDNSVLAAFLTLEKGGV